jgi:ABC-type nitrate/sulfonate/bicarbonate transport system substrate-binding protein
MNAGRLSNPLHALAALAALAILGLLTAAPGNAAEYYDSYDLTPRTDTVDLGVQPNAWPLAFISAVMQRDKLLAAELKTKGISLRTFAFRKGNDVYKLVGNGKLEMAFLGDMPTVNAIATTPTVVIGLGKRNFSSVVARDYSRLEELRGKKIGYSAGSSSHLVLLRGLEAAKMTEKDIELVTLEPAQMPDALENEQVAAYSAWEPTPSMSLARNPRNRAIYRGMSTDWLVFSRDFSDKQPEVAALLTASYVRAINWMRQKSANLDLAADWVIADSTAFTGKPPALPRPKVIDIARKDLLDVPGAPSIPAQVDGAPPLTRELAFLKAQGRLPADFDDSLLSKAFAYDGLKRVQADPKRHRLYQFDYAK